MNALRSAFGSLGKHCIAYNLLRVDGFVCLLEGCYWEEAYLWQKVCIHKQEGILCAAGLQCCMGNGERKKKKLFCLVHIVTMGFKGFLVRNKLQYHWLRVLCLMQSCSV